ncbi:MAG TPA: crosslink repair DNA glycosylase YcaQ family protein, partial [Streptosporangiaceae bacterium]|nr:crosslink repair DNA glycosylase YcaQ family protein [Streptosporangiaceae bacterium]
MTGWSLGSVPERRARLARRHLLAAQARAETAAEVAAAVIALHGTDPASVYLAAWARSADGHRAIGHAAVGRALYETGELVRMLGMRRTMFVVPADLAPVIQASCTDQIAQRMRSGLIRDLAAAGVAPDAGRWLDEVGDATVKALTARGAATGAEIARDEPRLRTQLTYAEGKNYGGSANITTRVLMLLSAERRIARGRPRGGWTSSQYEWTPADPWSAGSAADARAQLARRWLL